MKILDTGENVLTSPETAATVHAPTAIQAAVHF